MNTTPRFMPMVGDSMAPTVKPSDLVAVLPVLFFRGDGVYVIDVLGELNVVRASIDSFGRLVVGYDNPRYAGAGPMAQDVFEARLLGRVFAVCGIIDVDAMEAAGMLTGWYPGRHVADREGGSMTARRDFLAFMAGAVVARTVLPGVAYASVPQTSSATTKHADAELIAVCAEFDELERAYIATGGDHPAGSPEQAAADAKQARITEAQEPLLARMVELRATTREGTAARARSLALWDAELMKDNSGDTGACFTYAIVRDLIG